MKEVYLLRHAKWDHKDDKLTPEGIADAQNRAGAFPKFTLVYSSPLNRAQQTAQLISGQKPRTDERAKIPSGGQSDFIRSQIMEQRKTHPFGVVGVLFSIPELLPVLKASGSALADLVKETLHKLQDGEKALIVTHDGPISSAERILAHTRFDAPIDHVYEELEGIIVNEAYTIKRLTP